MSVIQLLIITGIAIAGVTLYIEMVRFYNIGTVETEQNVLGELRKQAVDDDRIFDQLLYQCGDASQAFELTRERHKVGQYLYRLDGEIQGLTVCKEAVMCSLTWRPFKRLDFRTLYPYPKFPTQIEWLLKEAKKQ